MLTLCVLSILTATTATTATQADFSAPDVWETLTSSTDEVDSITGKVDTFLKKLTKKN